ncbi:MAG: IS3 family transposase [Methylocella sp.]
MRSGAPRIHAALRAEGHKASRGRGARLIRHQGIRAITPRRFLVCTTGSLRDLPVPRTGSARNSPPNVPISSGSPT